jgi:hypothetical protein
VKREERKAKERSEVAAKAKQWRDEQHKKGQRPSKRQRYASRALGWVCATTIKISSNCSVTQCLPTGSCPCDTQSSGQYFGHVTLLGCVQGLHDGVTLLLSLSAEIVAMQPRKGVKTLQ